jgi:hypothetical protein
MTLKPWTSAIKGQPEAWRCLLHPPPPNSGAFQWLSDSEDHVVIDVLTTQYKKQPGFVNEESCYVISCLMV